MKIRPKMKKRKVPSSTPPPPPASTRKSVAKGRARDVCKQQSFLFPFHSCPIREFLLVVTFLPFTVSVAGYCIPACEGRTYRGLIGGWYPPKISFFSFLSPPSHFVFLLCSANVRPLWKSDFSTQCMKVVPLKSSLC